MSHTLLEIPQCDSPRLAWLKNFRVTTLKTEHQIGDEDEFGKDLFPWYAGQGVEKMDASNADDWIGGGTEHDAIVNWAIEHRVKLWNEI